MTSAAWQRVRSKLQNDQSLAEKDEPMQPGEAEAGVIWFERAQILHYSSIREIDIYQVQCLTLLSAFQAAVNSMPMSWLLASQALRIAQDIGLHVSNLYGALLLTPSARPRGSKSVSRSSSWVLVRGGLRMVSSGESLLYLTPC